MAKVAQRESNSRDLQQSIVGLEQRRRKLATQTSHEHDWRRLQYDAVCVLIQSQRASVDMHRRIVAALHNDVAVRSRLRLASLELASLIEDLHRLIRDVERTLGG